MRMPGKATYYLWVRNIREGGRVPGNGMCRKIISSKIGSKWLTQGAQPIVEFKKKDRSGPSADIYMYKGKPGSGEREGGTEA